MAQNKKKRDLRWVIAFLVIITSYGVGALTGYLPNFFPISTTDLWLYLIVIGLLIIATLVLVAWQFHAEPTASLSATPPLPAPTQPPIVVNPPSITINIPPQIGPPQQTVEPATPAPASLPPASTPSSIQRPELSPLVQPRVAELDQLEQEFDGSDALVVVGKGGQGKSTFANLYATRWLKQKRGMVFWYDAERGKLAGDQIVGYALAALGWRAGVNYLLSDYNKQGALGGLLADRVAQADANWLLVVSGLDESDCDQSGLLLDPELNALLERGCQGLAGSRLLLTARDRVLHSGKFSQPHYYNLQHLTAAASLAWLRGSLSRPDRFAEGKLKLAVGKDYADGYPYALTLLINALNNPPLDDVVAYLDELLSKPGQWYNERRGRSVLLDGIWAGLVRRGGLERTVQYVAIFQRPATAADLSGMLAAMQPPLSLDPANLREPALRDLLEQSKVGGQTAYSLHPLLRGYALEQQGAQVADYRRAAARYLQARNFAAHNPQQKSPRKVEDVQPLLDAFDQLTAAGDYEAAADLMFVNVEQGQEQLDLYDKLDRWGEARRLVQMWSVLVESGKLTIAQQGAALGNLGSAYSSLGEHHKAIGYYEDALSIFGRVGDKRGKGAVLGNLGNAYSSLGEYRKAIGYYEQRLEIAGRIGDLSRLGSAWNNMGVAYEKLKLYSDALACYLKAQPMRARLSNPDFIAQTESNIADVRAAVGEAEWPALLAVAGRLAADPQWRPTLPLGLWMQRVTRRAEM